MNHRAIRISFAAVLLVLAAACSQPEEEPAPIPESEEPGQDPDVAVVMEMIDAWNTRDWKKVSDLFTRDGVLHSMMIEPVEGRETIRKRIDTLGAGLESMNIEVLNIGKVGDVVFLERVDEFTYKGKEGRVPVVGVLEVRDGRVAEWREYYDRAQLIEAMGLEPDENESEQ